MAKKSRRKKVAYSQSKLVPDLSSQFQTVKKNILNYPNREKFLQQLATSESKQHLPDFQHLFDLNSYEIPLDNSISHVGGFAEVAENRCWISDEFNHRIVEVNEDWQVTKTFGEFGTGDSSFHYPRTILKLNNNEVAIIDSWNHRVKFYDIDGNFLNSIGEYGSGDECFFEPSGITEDLQGLLYVLDRCNHRIAVYSQKKILCFLGERGTGAERNQERFLAANPSLHQKLSLEFPTDIQYRNGKLYIADSGNDRVVIFDLKGTSCREIEGFNTPQQILFYGDTLAVTDMNNQRVVHLWENGETIFSYKFPNLSSSEENLYPESIFPYKDFLLFGFTNSPKILGLPLSENHVLSFLDKERKLISSYQFILNKTLKALEAGKDEEALAHIEMLLQDKEIDFNFRDVELLLPIFRTVSGNAHHCEKLIVVLERFINIGKNRLQEVLADVEKEYKSLLSARIVYVEAEGNYQDITVPEEEKDCGEDCAIQKVRFEKQEVIFFTTSMQLYDTTLLLKQLINYLFSFRPKENSVVLNHLLELSKTFIDSITQHFQKKGAFFSYANEEYLKNDFNKNQNWIKFAKSFVSVEKEDKIVALLFDSFSFFLPSLTKNIQFMNNNQGKSPLLMDVTSKLLELSICLRLEPLENKNDCFIKGVELYLEAFSRKFPREVSLGVNPEMVVFFTSLNQGGKEIPMQMNPLTCLQMLLLRKKGVIEEELDHYVKSELSNGTLDEALGAIVGAIQGVEGNLQTALDDVHKQGVEWGEKQHMLKLITDDHRKTSLLLREINIQEFTLGRSEKNIHLYLYHHLVLTSYLLIGNYLLLQRCLEMKDFDGVIQIMENIFQMNGNFKNRIESINNEIQLFHETSMQLIERRTSGIKQNSNEQEDYAKQLLKIEKGNKIPPFLSRHFSLVNELTENFFCLLMNNFDSFQNKKEHKGQWEKSLERIEEHLGLRSLLSLLKNSDKNDIAKVKRTLDFSDEVEVAGEADFSVIGKTGEDFFAFNFVTGEMKRYTKDWIDLGVVLNVENAGSIVRTVTTDSNNNLYVPLINRLHVYNSFFELTNVYSFHDLVPHQAISSIAIIKEKVYLCDRESGRILLINTKENSASICMDSDVLKKPISLLPLGNGNMLITSQGEKLLLIVDEDWNVLYSFDNSKGELPAKLFRSATQDNQGRIWAICPRSIERRGELYVFDDQLNYLFEYSEKNNGAHMFIAPFSIFSDDEKIYVADTLLNKVVSILSSE